MKGSRFDCCIIFEKVSETNNSQVELLRLK